MADRTTSRTKLMGAMSAMAMLAACTVQLPEEAQQQETSATADRVAALPPLPDALPLTARPAGQYRSAPAAHNLPAGQDLGWSDPGDDGYAWIDRADTLFDTIGDSPPDYGFGYDDGVEPWGWDTAGGYSVFAEPIDGGNRYYYYEPESQTPFFVRDPQRSYGYADDRLVGVFDNGGGLLPFAAAGAFASVGSRYFSRGRDLRRVSFARPRRSVAAPLWAARQPYVTRARQQWAVARDRQPRWQEYRARNGVGSIRPQVRYERQARRQAAQQFANWRQDDFRGASPNLYDRGRIDRRVANARREDRRDALGLVAQRQLAGDDRREARQLQRSERVEQRRAQQLAPQREQRQQQARAERQRDRAAAQGRQQRAERQAQRGRQVEARRTQQQAQRVAARRDQQRATRQAQGKNRRDQQQAQRVANRRDTQRAERQAQRPRQAEQRAARQTERAEGARRTQQQTAARRDRTQQQERRAAQTNRAASQRAERQQARTQQRAERVAARPDRSAERAQARASRPDRAMQRQQLRAERQARPDRSAQRQQLRAERQARPDRSAQRQQMRAERQARPDRSAQRQQMQAERQARPDRSAQRQQARAERQVRPDRSAQREARVQQRAARPDRQVARAGRGGGGGGGRGDAGGGRQRER